MGLKKSDYVGRNFRTNDTKRKYDIRKYTPKQIMQMEREDDLREEKLRLKMLKKKSYETK